jgi:hypothetical protein
VAVESISEDSECPGVGQYSHLNQTTERVVSYAYAADGQDFQRFWPVEEVFQRVRAARAEVL